MPKDTMHWKADRMKRPKPLESLILTIRDHRVMIDADLADLYGVETRTLNQAVKRNADRFPKDFMFRLIAEEQFPRSSANRGTRHLRERVSEKNSDSFNNRWESFCYTTICGQQLAPLLPWTISCSSRQVLKYSSECCIPNPSGSLLTNVRQRLQLTLAR